MIGRVFGRIALYVAVFAATSAEISEGPIVVNTSYGEVAGRYVISNYSTFYAFQEIPYAKPPIGPLRFQEPQPPEKWEGVLNTTANTKVCVQFEEVIDTRQNEDCLYLNVYTPKDPRNLSPCNILPVIVWIHGGSFLSGSGTYEDWGPQFFMEKEIIIVTINYRLGPLGFLTTSDEVIPGNNALKDQHLAFKWVQENIANFGGDPGKVTIMGQSAGASAVAYHLLSHKSEGLFRAAIMHSSSSLTCWSLNKYARNAAFTFGQALDSNFNASTATSEELLNLLQSVSVEAMKNNSGISIPQGEKNCFEFFYLVWTPTMEDEDYPNALVTGASHEKLLKGEFVKVPVLTGMNSQEILLFDLTLLSYISVLTDQSPAYVINDNLNMADANKEQAGIEIMDIYTRNQTFNDNLVGEVKFSSDCLFTTPISRSGHLKSHYSDVFFYEFSYIGEMGSRLTNQTVAGAEGVGHQVELQYLFENDSNEDLSEFPVSDLITQQRLLTLWVSFATYLNPTFEQLDIFQGVVWPTVQPDEFIYLDIGDNLTLRVNPKEYFRWSLIYGKYAERILDTY